MTNNNVYKGIEDLKQMSLSAAEKEKMFSYLQDYVDTHPVIQTQKSSAWFSWMSFTSMNYRVATLGLAVLILAAGGGVTWAAEYALPGDVLYPVKLHVNESIEGALKVTPQEKAEWQEKKIVRRLQEAEALVAQGKLDDEKRVAIEAEVEKGVNAYMASDFSVEKEDGNSDDRKITRRRMSEEEIEKLKTDFAVKVSDQLDKIKEKKEAAANVSASQDVQVNNLELKVREKIAKVKDNKKENVHSSGKDPIEVMTVKALDVNVDVKKAEKPEIKVENHTNTQVEITELKPGEKVEIKAPINTEWLKGGKR
jgi:hypothetical protein